jgi:hypothetical protein
VCLDCAGAHFGVDADAQQAGGSVSAMSGEERRANPIQDGKLLEVVHIDVHLVLKSKSDLGLGLHGRVKHNRLGAEASVERLRKLSQRSAFAAEAILVSVLQDLKLRIGLGGDGVEKVSWEGGADGLEHALDFGQVPDNCQRRAFAQRPLLHSCAHGRDFPRVALLRELRPVVVQVHGRAGVNLQSTASLRSG